MREKRPSSSHPERLVIFSSRRSESGRDHPSIDEVDFLKALQLTANRKISSGDVLPAERPELPGHDGDIIIVEDLFVDSGLSMQYIRDLTLKQNPLPSSCLTLFTSPHP